MAKGGKSDSRGRGTYDSGRVRDGSGLGHDGHGARDVLVVGADSLHVLDGGGDRDGCEGGLGGSDDLVGVDRGEGGASEGAERGKDEGVAHRYGSACDCKVGWRWERAAEEREEDCARGAWAD